MFQAAILKNQKAAQRVVLQPFYCRCLRPWPRTSKRVRAQSPTRVPATSDACADGTMARGSRRGGQGFSVPLVVYAAALVHVGSEVPLVQRKQEQPGCVSL